MKPFNRKKNAPQIPEPVKKKEVAKPREDLLRKEQTGAKETR